MNRAQLNQRIVDDALYSHREARLAKAAVIGKVATWFPEGGHEQWAEECFKRLWLRYHETEGSIGGFKETLCDVLHPRFPGHSSRGCFNRGLDRLHGYHGLNVRLPLEERRFASSRTDDEFEELIEDWNFAIRQARDIRDPLRGPFAEKVPISKWILDRFDGLLWHSRDKEFWRYVFGAVEVEAFLPPKGISYATVRRKVWLWHYFRQVITDKVKPSMRHIPRGWYDDSKPPRTAADWVKRTRYIVRVVKDAPGAARGDDPIADYGERIGKMLNGAMRRMQKDINDPCMDNFRFSAMDKPGDLRRYKDRRASGCCGSCDQVVTIHGRKFVIGCNYGH